jgi:hypothetical protein
MRLQALILLLVLSIVGFTTDGTEDYKSFCQVVYKLADLELKVLELDSEKAVDTSSWSYMNDIKEKQLDAETALPSIKDDLSIKSNTTGQQWLRFTMRYFRMLEVMLESDNPALLEPRLRIYANELKNVTKDSSLILPLDDEGETQKSKELDRDNRKVFEDQGLDINLIGKRIVLRFELFIKPAIVSLEGNCQKLIQLQEAVMVDQITHPEEIKSAQESVSLRYRTLFLKENLTRYMNELRQIEVISSQLKNEMDLLFDGKASIDNLKIILGDLDSINEVLEELDKL